ncbi:AAA family ATPase [Microtetraspora malaysiensis]|uniref:AAA family ATPase n=1 Tax=Microtetraspora malaysiensis TaxID=161358 RepID=UPI003D8C69B5
MVVLRGNSGAGKTSVAQAVRRAYGYGLALIGQDTVRRELLRERDVPGGVNIGLIDTIVRYSLDHGYHVLLEGILTASRYGPMLHALSRDHAGTNAFFYLDVSWPETVRRHATRPQRREFTPEEMRRWYRERDLLPDGCEAIISEESSLEATARHVLHKLALPVQRAASPPDASSPGRP